MSGISGKAVAAAGAGGLLLWWLLRDQPVPKTTGLITITPGNPPGSPPQTTPPGTVPPNTTPPQTTPPILIVPADRDPPTPTTPWPKIPGLPPPHSQLPQAPAGLATMPWLHIGIVWDGAVEYLPFSDVWAPPGYALFSVDPLGTKPRDYDNWLFAYDFLGVHSTGMVPRIAMEAPVLCANLVTTEQKLLEQGGPGLLAFYDFPKWYIRAWSDRGFLVMGWRSQLCLPGWSAFQLFAVSPEFFRSLRNSPFGPVIIALPYGYPSTHQVWSSYSSFWADPPSIG